MKQLNHRSIQRIVLLSIVVALFIAINVLIITNSSTIETLRTIGLPGLFVLSVISGFNVIVPVPVSLLYPSFSVLGFSAGSLIGIIALGMTIGDTFGYLIGYSASSSVHETQIGKRVEYWVTHHPKSIALGTLLYAMFFPAPNELIVIPLAALRVPWYQILIPVFIGNILFTMMLAFGATQITQLFL